MLAVAPQFDLLSCLLAMVTAVLPVRTIRLDGAIARRVGTLRGFGHLEPPSNAAPNSTPRRSISQARPRQKARSERNAHLRHLQPGRQTPAAAEGAAR